MLLCFTLTMPSASTWNGKWTGQDQSYAKIINVGYTKKAQNSARELINKSPYHYNFGDGWIARIDVRQVDAREAAGIRKQSKGFLGYDWMIASIRKNRRIIIRRQV